MHGFIARFWHLALVAITILKKIQFADAIDDEDASDLEHTDNNSTVDVSIFES